MFWNNSENKGDNKAEWTKIYDLLRENSVEVVKLKGEFDRLEQSFKVLRGLVNRKLKYDENDTDETIIKNDGFDNLRKSGV